MAEDSDEVVGFGEWEFAGDDAYSRNSNVNAVLWNESGAVRTDAVDGIEDAHKVNLDVDREGAFEPVGHFPAFGIVSFEHGVCERDLFVIVRWEESDLCTIQSECVERR